MARRYASFFPQRMASRVPAMAYVGGIEGDDMISADFGAPTALNSTGILAAQSVAAAGSAVPTAPYAGTEAQMGKWGRCLRLVASGAYAGVVQVFGRDYLGQRVSESLTANGATPVLGLKAFRYIDLISWVTTGAVTIDLGWRDCFGLPFKLKAMVSEVKNAAIAANAGTVIAGLTTATAPTATNADVRGTYAPATVLPNDVNTFEVRFITDTSNLHGSKQFTA